MSKHHHLTFVFIEGNVLEMVFEPPVGEPLRENAFYISTFQQAKIHNAALVVGDWVIDTTAVVAFNVLEHDDTYDHEIGGPPHYVHRN